MYNNIDNMNVGNDDNGRKGTRGGSNGNTGRRDQGGGGKGGKGHKSTEEGYSVKYILNVGISLSVPQPSNNTDIKLIGNSIQLMFNKTVISESDISNIKHIIKDIKNIFVHSSYQINIASPFILTNDKKSLYNPSLDILKNEIGYTKKIGGKGIIVHMGKNTGLKYDNAVIYNNMVNFIIQLFKNCNGKMIDSIILETPAGQGGEMCSNLADFIDFILLFKSQSFYKKLGICIDTCHIFQAGYDINDENIIKEVHKLFEPVMDKIKLIHLNDSFHPVNGHIDRHANIGDGYIRIINLVKFIKPFVKKKIPLILETSPPYDTQLDKLR
jgi:deoxyribonuclease-4